MNICLLEKRKRLGPKFQRQFIISLVNHKALALTQTLQARSDHSFLVSVCWTAASGRKGKLSLSLYHTPGQPLRSCTRKEAWNSRVKESSHSLDKSQVASWNHRTKGTRDQGNWMQTVTSVPTQVWTSVNKWKWQGQEVWICSKTANPDGVRNNLQRMEGSTKVKLYIELCQISLSNDWFLCLAPGC